MAPTISLRLKRSTPCLTYFFADGERCAEAVSGDPTRKTTAMNSRRFIFGVRRRQLPGEHSALLRERGERPNCYCTVAGKSDPRGSDAMPQPSSVCQSFHEN